MDCIEARVQMKSMLGTGNRRDEFDGSPLCGVCDDEWLQIFRDLSFVDLFMFHFFNFTSREILFSREHKLEHNKDHKSQEGKIENRTMWRNRR